MTLNLTTTSQNNSRSEVFYALNQRYAEAYDVASGLVSFGRATKWVALAIGAVFAIVGLYYLAEGGLGQIAAIMCLGGGIATASSGFVAGVVIAAAGQMMLCTADTAVNTSPLLNHAQKSDIMRVPQLPTD